VHLDARGVANESQQSGTDWESSTVAKELR
jgi:hypothetical protein